MTVPESDDEIDVLQWWSENQKNYPKLFQLSLKFVCVLGTSSLSESTFSMAKNLITQKRSSLMPETINNLMFLKSHFDDITNSESIDGDEI